MFQEGANLKTGTYVILALAILAAGLVLSPDSYAGGRHHGHWRGHHHGGDSFHLGLGFVFPIYSYGYPYYPPPPAYYPVPARLPPPAVTPEQHAYTASDEKPEYCREYTKEVVVDGKEQVAFGTACRQQDGRWRIMN